MSKLGNLRDTLDNEVLLKTYDEAKGLIQKGKTRVSEVIEGFKLKIKLLGVNFQNAELNICCRELERIYKEQNIEGIENLQCFEWVVLDPTKSQKGFEQNSSSPNFPWPPPSCFQKQTLITSLKEKYATYADIDSALYIHLKSAGYDQIRYYNVPNGFAIITQLERFNSDGTSKSDNKYWGIVDTSINYFNMDYISKAMFQSSGNYRFFVFIISSSIWDQQPREKVYGNNWLSAGINRLSPMISKKAIARDTYLDLLVYEIEVPQSSNRGFLKCPGVLSINTHLKQSALTKSLKLK